MHWMRTARLSWQGFPQTRARAQEAFEAGTKIPKSKLVGALKQRLLEWQYNGMRRYFQRNPDAIAVVWNGLNGTRRVFAEAAKDAGCKRLLCELGPLPNTLTMDPNGVNFANSLPCQSEPYLAWAKGRNIGKWQDVRDTITQRQGNKHSSNQNGDLPSLDAPFIFVPLQVPGDSQLRLFGGLYRSVPDMIAMLHKMATHLPDGWHIRVKEHPSAEISYGDLISEQRTRVFVDNETDTFSQVQSAKVVLTTNSSVGLEAMFFAKPVVAVGDCFWAIPDIAVDARDPSVLKSIFQNPDQVSFDPEARAAFLEFLCTEYFLDARDPAAESKKIRRRLNGDWGFDAA